MRVVAGSLKGRIIKSITGNKTRPTLDKVKEAMFNALGQFFLGGVALDLFAGSGNLGIEAISRGIDKCIFIEKDYHAYKIIKENLENLKIDDKAIVYKNDAFKALKFLLVNNYKFDYIFLDPPYNKQRINDIIIFLEDNNMLNDNALIICEYLKEDELISSYQNIHLNKTYLYGITKISIYKKGGEVND